MPNPTLKMDSVTVLDKDSDGVHFKNSLIHSSTTFPAGHVIQVIQGTATEQSQNGSNIVLINESFTPKSSGSKFYVSFMIPNLTGDASTYFQAKAYIGTSATPTSNQEIIYCRTHGQGTGASDTMTLNGTDFGTYTASNTNTHYVALLASTSGSWTIGRHSSIIKLQCMEIAG